MKNIIISVLNLVIILMAYKLKILLISILVLIWTALWAIYILDKIDKYFKGVD